MKGLIVEQHEDRFILNTEQGEQAVMREDIAEIDYDEPAQQFFQVGESNEKAERWGEALAYYEKALQLQPDLEDAKRAVVRVRNRFWSKASTGPNDEVQRMQDRYDLRGQIKAAPADKVIKDRSRDAARALDAGLGLTIEPNGDWVTVSRLTLRKDAALAGLKKGDRLVSIDGRSLRYLSADVVRQKLLEPPQTLFVLEFERDRSMFKTGLEKNLSEFGFKAGLEYRGTVITHVQEGSQAERSGLKENDLLVTVNGVSMRYLPLKKLLDVLLVGAPENSTISFRRSVTLTRK